MALQLNVTTRNARLDTIESTNGTPARTRVASCRVMMATSDALTRLRNAKGSM